MAASSPSPSMRTISGDDSSACTTGSSEPQSYTESALKELYQQVNSMPESAKKKKLIRQVCQCTLWGKSTNISRLEHLIVLYLCVFSLRSSLCWHLRLNLGHHSAGNIGVHALWVEWSRFVDSTCVYSNSIHFSAITLSLSKCSLMPTSNKHNQWTEGTTNAIEQCFD